MIYNLTLQPVRLGFENHPPCHGLVEIQVIDEAPFIRVTSSNLKVGDVIIVNKETGDAIAKLTGPQLTEAFHGVHVNVVSPGTETNIVTTDTVEDHIFIRHIQMPFL